MANEELTRSQNLKQAAANIPAAFRLVWDAHHGATIVMALLTLGGALIPAAQAWVGKLIIDSVVASINGQVEPTAGLMAVLPYLLIEFVLILATIGHRAGALADRARTARALELFAQHAHHPQSPRARSDPLRKCGLLRQAAKRPPRSRLARAANHERRLLHRAEHHHADLVRRDSADVQHLAHAAPVRRDDSGLHRAIEICAVEFPAAVVARARSPQAELPRISVDGR